MSPPACHPKMFFLAQFAVFEDVYMTHTPFPCMSEYFLEGTLKGIEGTCAFASNPR